MRAPPRLWPHQDEALHLCQRAHAETSSRLLFQFPPGTGKTEVAVRAALDWMKRRPFGRVVTAVPTAPILDQFYRRLALSCPSPVAIDKAGKHALPTARCVVASINSLWGRLDKYDPDVLLIYDEAHHANLEAEENLRVARGFHHVLGLTANAWPPGCAALWGPPALVLRLRDAQRQGRCEKCGTWQRVAQGGGPCQGCQAPVTTLSPPYCLHRWSTPHGPFGIAFYGNNAEAEAAAHKIPGATWVGVNSGQVPERIAAWRAGRYPVICANMMLREGFDEPRCHNVWIAKATASDVLYVQMAGRALRTEPGKVAHLHCQTPTIADGVREALLRC